jgi:hypothetical protein
MDEKKFTSHFINQDYNIGILSRKIVDLLMRVEYLEMKSVRTMRWLIVTILLNIIFTIGIIYGFMFYYNG